MKFDGDTGTGLVRDVSFHHLTIDGNVAAGGNAGICINDAENIRFFGGHIEARDPHIRVTDSGNGATRLLQFYGMQFGGLNDPVNAGKAIDWISDDADDGGEGSVFYACRFSAGDISITSTFKVLFERTVLLGAAFAGSGYVRRESTEDTVDMFRQDPTMQKWSRWESDKEEPTHTTRFQEHFTTVSTTDNTETSLLAQNMGTGNSLAIWAYVTATKSDNSEQALYYLMCMFKNVGGTVSVLGSPSITAIETVGAWAATCDGSLNNARIRVTGGAATTIRWAGWVKFIIHVDE
jgi:hypothetical protein